jgi:CheY-like chemotaxis protein
MYLSSFKVADCKSPKAMVVLLVEDDAALRTLAALYLQEEHFDVLQACNGPEALRIARTHSRIDLLLTDVEMGGGFNGIELASRLLAERPNLPALIMSGLPDSERAAAQKGFVSGEAIHNFPPETASARMPGLNDSSSF